MKTPFNFLRALCAGLLAAVLCGNAFANTALHDTAEGGSAADAGNECHKCPELHKAAGDGNIAEVKRLIGGGADVNAKDRYGWRPLHYAAAYGKTEIANALIKAGADIEGKDDDGEPPLHAAVYYGQSAMATALIKAGANVNAENDYGRTLLQDAVELHGEDSEIARILKEAGAK